MIGESMQGRNEVKIQILGARCSGTKFLERLIRFNSTNVCTTLEYAFKHFIPFKKPITNDTDIIFLVIIRNPYDWVRSLHANPWHAHKKLRNLSFSEFIRTEWFCVYDKQAKVYKDDPRYGKEMMFERDPATKQRYKNIMRMRTAKYQYWSKISELAKNFAYIRYEDLAADPLYFLKGLSLQRGLEIKRKINIPIGRDWSPISFKRKFIYRVSFGLLGGFKKKKYPRISKNDLSFINANLCWEQEEFYGYKIITDPDEIR